MQIRRIPQIFYASISVMNWNVKKKKRNKNIIIY